MDSSRRRQSGVGTVGILAAVAAVALVGVGVWYIASDGEEQPRAGAEEPSERGADSQVTTPATRTGVEEEATGLVWRRTETGWQATGTPPDCPGQPMMQVPVDLGKVTSVLYPGQVRGGNYKPHGGFRLDGTPNAEVTVTAPVDGFLVRGAQYLAEGEIQYTLDVVNNCGVMYRLGHLRALPENLMQLTTRWPPAVEGDSRTNDVEPALPVEQGDVMATSVGIVAAANSFFDWGVYDLRNQNEVSRSGEYQAAHQEDQELAWHAVCWFDWVPEADTQVIRALPSADPTSGTTSDYCR